MGDLLPKFTKAQLANQARVTLKSGHELIQSLPAMVSDAKRASTADPKDPKSDYFGLKFFDPKGFEKNRELARDINAVLEKHKARDAQGPHFVLAWRLYANDGHPRWHDKEHICGCGCGCFTPPGDK
jgi:hypothetical protein